MLKIIFLFFFLNGAFAQDKDPKTLGEFGKKTSKNFVFVDENNDKIMVLDLAIRHELKETSKQKNISSQLEEDVWSNFYKESLPNEMNEQKVVFDIYKIESGDDWQSISLKLYKDTKYWPHLQSWNEELLKDFELPVGTEIKYLKNIQSQTDLEKKK